jgi:hypothetical protein
MPNCVRIYVACAVAISVDPVNRRSVKLIPNLVFFFDAAKSGRAIAEAVSRWIPAATAWVHARAWQVGFVVVKVASGQVFRVLRFPPPKAFFPPTFPSSQSPGTVSRGLATS